MASANVTVRWLDPAPIRRGGLAFSLACQGILLDAYEEPGMVSEIRAIEEMVLGEPLSMTDVAEAVLEATA